MSQSSFSWSLFEKNPIVGIVRGYKAEAIRKIFPLYQQSGLTNIEITMNTEDALQLISDGVEKYGDSLNVGAGTVCSMKDLNKALMAGAQFIVTPVLDEEVITTCNEEGVPIFPGAFTPTEIYKAWTLGGDMVKVFPATQLGAKYIKDVKGPLNEIKLLPTGGVDLSNIKDFVAAGASGFGIGSKLLNRDLIDAEDWDGLLEHFKKFVEVLSTK